MILIIRRSPLEQPRGLHYFLECVLKIIPAICTLYFVVDILQKAFLRHAHEGSLYKAVK